MADDNPRDYNFLVREYISDPSSQFEGEKFGVADKMLLAQIVRSTAEIFEKFESQSDILLLLLPFERKWNFLDTDLTKILMNSLR